MLHEALDMTPAAELLRRTDVAGLRANLAHAAEDYVINKGRVKSAGNTVEDQRVDHRGAQFSRMHVADAALVLSGRRAGAGYDKGAVGHSLNN